MYTNDKYVCTIFRLSFIDNQLLDSKKTAEPHFRNAFGVYSGVICCSAFIGHDLSALYKLYNVCCIPIALIDGVWHAFSIMEKCHPKLVLMLPFAIDFHIPLNMSLLC